MAIYYSRISTISRSRGQSAVAAAAYRCGGRMLDERTARNHDYRRKGGVLSARMLAPQGADWALDVETVWNLAEAAEVRSNARTARELILALPSELTQSEQIALAMEIGGDLVERYRVAALVAVHAPDKRGDTRNVHVHLLITTREAGPNGFGAKTRVLDDRTTGPVEAEWMRERAAERINAALTRAGHAAVVDPRRLSVRAEEAAALGDLDGVALLTRTPELHQGPASTATARRKQFSRRAQRNAAVRRDNRRIELHGRRLVQAWRRQHPGLGVVSAKEAYLQGLRDAAQESERAVEQLRRAFDESASVYTGLVQRLLAARRAAARAEERMAEQPVVSTEAMSGTVATQQKGAGLTPRQWAEYRRALRARAINNAEHAESAPLSKPRKYPRP